MATKIDTTMTAKVHSTEEIKKQFVRGELGAILDWEVRDTKTGMIVPNPLTGKPHVGIKKAESYTRQFFDLLLCHFLEVASCVPIQITDIGGVVREISHDHRTMECVAASGSVSTGIIVGTGVGVPTITDYVIGTIIGHDSGAHGAGTMQYGTVTFGAPASDATTSQFTITRNFANATAGAITVQEIALYCRANAFSVVGSFYDSPTVAYFMTIRDLTGAIVVGVGQTLTVNYRPQCVI